MRLALLYSPRAPTPREGHWLGRSLRREATAGSDWPDFIDQSEVGLAADVAAAVAALQEGGSEVLCHAVRSAAGLCRFLEEQRPDLIFNRCEDFLGDSQREMNVAAVFELFGIPFTGSPAATLAVALDKAAAKAIFHAHDLPTPRYAVIGADDELEALANGMRGRLRSPHSSELPGFPLIVKPVREDASIGIDVHAVVRDRDALARRVNFIRREFGQPALVEEFIDGREMAVAVIAAGPGGFTPLPISEILFDQLPPGLPRIVSYEAKWLLDSPCDRGTVPRCPADVAPDLADRLRGLALAAVRALGIRDYARVDFRVRTAPEEPLLLEVNPNPDLSRDSGFIRAAAASGRTYGGTLREIAARARERSSRAPAAG